MVHPSSRECTLAFLFRPISFLHLRARRNVERKRVALRASWYIFFCFCVSACVSYTQRHFYLEEAATVSQGKGQNPSAIKTYSEFANLKREPSSTNFVILSVTISSSR